jgi:hypothetical protein
MAIVVIAHFASGHDDRNLGNLGEMVALFCGLELRKGMDERFKSGRCAGAFKKVPECVC